MAFQFLPIIKALAPFVAQIATAAIPAFTAKTETTGIDPVTAKQIEELQAAATQNAQSIHTLAEQLQQAIQGIEGLTKEAKQQVASYKLMLIISLCCSALSLSTALYLLISTH